VERFRQLRVKHQREGIRDFKNCVACHRSAEGEHGGREGGGGRERRSGWELD
jgi:cytochrome c peroxidase